MFVEFDLPSPVGPMVRLRVVHGGEYRMATVVLDSIMPLQLSRKSISYGRERQATQTRSRLTPLLRLHPGRATRAVVSCGARSRARECRPVLLNFLLQQSASGVPAVQKMTRARIPFLGPRLRGRQKAPPRARARQLRRSRRREFERTLSD
ncbi:hypothetical protein BKA93DRAFT_576777 [Sparassis latifolia]